jgi:hypothetical protein
VSLPNRIRTRFVRIKHSCLEYLLESLQFGNQARYRISSAIAPKTYAVLPGDVPEPPLRIPQPRYVPVSDREA